MFGRLGLEQILHAGGEHVAAGGTDQLVVLIGLVDVHADDQEDHAQQAQTGQQDDFQADGESVEHRANSRMDEVLAAGRG
ncbi:hypothetical protein D3C86_1929350 [compost metagenome]